MLAKVGERTLRADLVFQISGDTGCGVLREANGGADGVRATCTLACAIESDCARTSTLTPALSRKRAREPEISD